MAYSTTVERGVSCSEGEATARLFGSSGSAVQGPWGPEGLGAGCVKLGFATPEQVQECLRLQGKFVGRTDQVPRLGEILVERGFVTPEQVARVLALQGQGIQTCLRCHIQFDVPLRRVMAGMLCPRCHHPLVSVPRLDTVSVVEERPILLPEEPLPFDVAQASLDPGRRFGKYVILKNLGTGGSGVVQLAWDTFLGQKVALKRLRSSAAEDPSLAVWGAQRILVEARSTIRLRHPGIVRIYDAGQIDQTHFLSMEYVEGGTLDAVIDASAKAGRVSPFHEDPVRTLGLLAGVARALGYAHSRPTPVVHCDLKPGNIMVDLEGQPRLLDFGLSRVLRTSLEEDHEICGTPGYMAPEQAQGRTADIDVRTDVYGFGAILYEFLTGRPPFRGRPEVVLRAVITCVPEAPTEVLKQLRAAGVTPSLQPIPPFLEDLCMRCLAKEKELRPASMLEIYELLERAARPAPLPAGMPTRVPDLQDRLRARRRRFARRVGTLMSAASLVLAFVFSFRNTGAPPLSSIGHREVEGRLVAFQPDRALSLARLLALQDPGGPDRVRALGLQEESRRIQGLRLSMEAALPLRLEALHLKQETLGDVALLRGADGLLRAKGSDGRERVFAWSDLEPSQIVSLARSLGVVDAPEGCLALALYCLRVGRLLDAQTLLESLLDGPLGLSARLTLQAASTPAFP